MPSWFFFLLFKIDRIIELQITELVIQISYLQKKSHPQIASPSHDDNSINFAWTVSEKNSQRGTIILLIWTQTVFDHARMRGGLACVFHKNEVIRGQISDNKNLILILFR